MKWLSFKSLNVRIVCYTAINGWFNNHSNPQTKYWLRVVDFSFSFTLQIQSVLRSLFCACFCHATPHHFFCHCSNSCWLSRIWIITMTFKLNFDFLPLLSIFLTDTGVLFCLFCSSNYRSGYVHPLLGNLRLISAKSQSLFLHLFHNGL